MRGRIACACIASALLLAGCGNLFDTAAAVVGNNKITMREVSQALERFKETGEYEQLAAQGDAQSIQRRFEQAHLSELIRSAVLTPKAEEFEITVTDEEVQETIEGIKDDYGSQSAFEEALKEAGLNQDQLTEAIYDNILEDKVREEVTGDIEPSETEIEEFYEENIADYTRIRSSHILVREFGEATRLANQLQEAPKNQLDDLFARLARENSIDSRSARRGGDLGFTTAGQLADRYERAAADLRIGEVSDPVQTEFGYHIIRVTEREVTPFADVRDAISQQLGEGAAEEKWQEWLTDAYRAADIRINSRYGELDLESKQVVDATSESIPGAVVTPTPTPSPRP